MNLKRIPFFILLLQLSACSPSLDERFYGTWLHPLNETEPVVFREDGTVSWFGEEGTFESYEHERGCHPHDPLPIFCGSSQGVEVTVSGDTYKILPDFDTHENSWWLTPDGDTLSQSYYGNAVLLFRAGTFESPVMPPNFTKLGEGWSIPNNRGYKGSSTYFDSSSDHLIAHSANPLLASLTWGTIYSYNESTDSWNKHLQGSYGEGHRIGNELILHKSSRFDEASDGYIDHFRTSFDNGTTWNDLPQLKEGNYSDRWNYAYSLTGSTVVQKIDVTTCSLHGPGYCDTLYRNYEIWTLDATAHSPSWVLRTSFNLPDHMNVKLYTHPTIGTIAWSANDHDHDQNHAQVSTDGGATWSTFDPKCEDAFEVTPYQQGFFCQIQGSLVGFNSTTNAWSTYDVSFDEILPSGDPTDGVYIRRANQVIKWQPNGTETVVTTLSASLGYGDVFVFDDQVIVNKFGVWRAFR